MDSEASSLDKTPEVYEKPLDEETSQFKANAVDSDHGFEHIPTLTEVDPPRDLILGDFTKIVGSWGKLQKVIPFEENDGVISIAIADPLNISAIDMLKVCYGKPIKIFVCAEDEIMRAINGVRTSLMSDRDNALDVEENEGDEISGSLKIDVTDDEDEDAPIIRYVNTLIFRAATQRASDIHIEPFEESLKVRFRIDGVLQDIDTEDKSFQSAIISRVKVMSNLNIAEKRLPQDGRIGIKIAGQDVDIRVSTVPTKYGERIVMRLLDKSKVMLEMSTLGLTDNHSKSLYNVLQKNHGILLVTGPTGSGKTTTLYACLQHINSSDKNILTVEDPIEYELGGVGQMQVNSKINFTFASGLRSILRQDPDVIMIGEIRDLETVEIAVQASLTGHLVFSTLHTNDAPGAITRLLDMGVEPFLISSSLLMVVGQRLVRCLCPDCKVPIKLTSEQFDELGVVDKQARETTTYTRNDKGCPTCQLSGYKGRTGIHEMLVIDEPVRSAIMQRANATQIRQAASELSSLRNDGAAKVLRGETSFDEVLRVTQEDVLE